MTGRSVFLPITGFLCTIALGDPLPDPPALISTPVTVESAAAVETPEIEPPAELTQTIAEQDAAIKLIEQKDAEARAALSLWYASELDTMRQDAVTQGDLEHVLALDLERQRIDNDISPEEKAKLFYNLRELRSRFERQRAEQMRHATADVRAGLQRYAVALDQLAAIFLQHGNVSAARVVTNARLSMLGAAPTTAVNSAPAPAGYGSWGSSVPPAPDSTGSGSASGSRTSSGSWGTAAATAQGTTAAKGTFSAGSAPAKTWQSASVGNGAPSWAVPKPATGPASAPSATSLSAPPRVQAAQQTLKNLASQVSARGSAPSPGVTITRPSGPGGASAPRGGTGVWAR
jgi:hypothetical protein